MNFYLILAGVLTGSVLIGHLTYSKRQYLLPIQQADFDPVVKTVIHCLFHYCSIFMLLSSLILFACGFEAISYMHSFGILIFIALSFGLFAIWQVYISFSSELEKPLRSLFQWLFFTAISAFTLMGVLP